MLERSDRAFALALLLGLALLAAGLAPAVTKAAPPVFTEFCHSGSAGGQCEIPRGIAVDPVSGDVYVVDQRVFGSRIQVFTAWGGFLRAWGWDVVATGPGDDTIPPEDELEVCVPTNGDVCKGGSEGSGTGQFSGAQGVTLDSEGAIYAFDLFNRRVQKFSPDGEFLLMFGGEVNKTKVEAAAPEAEQNVCPIDPGDVCQKGTVGVGNGQFGELPTSSFIAASPNGETIYVGDVDRIQEFDTEGHYTGEIALPEVGVVGSLAVDPVSGDIYFAYSSPVVIYPNPGAGFAKQPNIHRLDPLTGEKIGDPLEIAIPTVVTVDAKGHVYGFEAEHHSNSPEPQFDAEVLKFDSSGNLIEGFGKGELNASTGLATSSACGIDGTDVLVSNSPQLDSFVRIYGPAPDPDICPPPEVPPSIEDSYAVSVGTDGAVVRADINPQFWADTAYHVQYGTEECLEGGWEASCVEEQPSAPGVTLTDQVTNAVLATKGVFLGASEALLPDTEYRYRFVAQSSGGGPVRGVGGTESKEGEERSFHTFPLPVQPKTDCPNQAFRTGSSANLPDCRAYEMVSPLEKNSGVLARPSETVLDQAKPDGEALTFASGGGNAFGDPDGGPGIHQHMADRDAAGWSSRSIAAPRGTTALLFGEDLNTRFKLFSEDLCFGWELQDTAVPLAAGAPAGVPGLYRRDNCGEGEGSHELLTSVFPPGFDPALENNNNSSYLPQAAGFSADGSVSFFRADAALTEDACDEPNQGKGLYQVYASAQGQLRLVSVLPSGIAACTHSTVGNSSISAGFDSLWSNRYQAVSEDGSRVFWTATTDATPTTGSELSKGFGTGKLYLRLNPTQPQSKLNGAKKCTEATKACTLAVSAQGEALSGTSASRYLSAAADGSVAIFQTGEDIYEFDVGKALAGEAATVQIAHKATGSDLFGFMGASEDASRIYLVSREALDEGASAGQPNLYLHDRGLGFDFIATLSSQDVRNTDESTAAPSPIATIPSLRTSRISPDGLHAAFASSSPALAEQVAGYDNTDLATGVPASEVYLYDATANGGEGEILCASCNPSGARPQGREVWSGDNGKSVLPAAAQIRGWTSALHPSRFLSGDGSRLFFESFESLVPRDTNGKADVYEWTRAGDGQECLEEAGGELFVAQSGSCLALISSGKGAEDSEFVDASADGRDVFIYTGSSLLPQDIAFDDIYDARAGGGFPQPAPPRPECEGEACQGAPAPPEDPTPASSTFQGAGNMREGGKARKPCPRGRHRAKARNGKSRCVKRNRTGKASRNRGRNR